MSDENRSVYRYESRSVCKECRKYPPAPRNWLCDHCAREMKGKVTADSEIQRIHAAYVSERSKPAPAMGYTVRRGGKSG
jgi:hypothetical protein